MRQIVLFTLVCALSGQTFPARACILMPVPASFGTLARTSFQTFDKGAVYGAMAAGNREKIDEELSVVRGSDTKEKEAYEGALLMRKAGLLNRAREKLATFKSGYIKLERSVAADTANIEYRFLRLMIQEHAPKVVHYDKDRDRDSKAIIQSFSTLSPVLQKAILNYCPSSKLLHEKDLKS